MDGRYESTSFPYISTSCGHFDFSKRNMTNETCEQCSLQEKNVCQLVSPICTCACRLHPLMCPITCYVYNVMFQSIFRTVLWKNATMTSSHQVVQHVQMDSQTPELIFKRYNVNNITSKH